jgi:tetratricopeptide (TPR) repeat protein
VKPTAFKKDHSEETIFKRAVQHHQAGQLTEALVLYDQVTISDPKNTAAYCNKAAIQANQGKHEDAKNTLEKAIPFSPEDPDIHYALGNCLTTLGRLNNAIDAYGLAVKFNPDFAEAHFRLGFVLSEIDRISDGFSHFMRRAHLVHGAAQLEGAGAREPLHKIKHDREHANIYLIS